MSDIKSVDLFGIPDDLIKAESRSKKSPDTSNKLFTFLSHPDNSRVSSDGLTSATPRTVLPKQGFLPGLSRRGRPRLSKPISAVERTAEHRRQRIADGAKRVEIILEGEVSRALDRLAEHFKEPKSEVIATLIRKAVSRIKDGKV